MESYATNICCPGVHASPVPIVKFLVPEDEIVIDVEDVDENLSPLNPDVPDVPEEPADPDGPPPPPPLIMYPPGLLPS